MPKVSIIVPVYNVEQYIEECVRSLFEQTLEDIEIILVDDCSPDNSIEVALRVLEEYPNRKDQVKVLRHEQNTGTGIVRRDGFNASSSKYVVYVDSDDFVDPNFAKKLYDKAEECGADMTICDFYRYYDGKTKRDTIVPKGVSGNGENVRNDIINRKVAPFLVLKLLRRELLEGDILWPKESMGDDTLLSTQATYRSRKIVHVKEPLYYYRYNPNSITKLLDREHCIRNLHGFKVNVEDVIRFLEREGAGKEFAYGIKTNKIRTKNRVLKVIGLREARKLWWKTYPEMNKALMFGDKDLQLTFKECVWFWFLILGVYPKGQKRMKKICKPRKEFF